MKNTRSVKIDPNRITSMELSSTSNSSIRNMYDLLYNVRVEDNNEEIVTSPYVRDRNKVVYTVRNQIRLDQPSGNNGVYRYTLKSKGRDVHDIVNAVLIHHTFPTVKVKDEFRETTCIKRCTNPGHILIQNAVLYHDEVVADIIDNVRLDQHLEFNIPNDRKDFYRRMVGECKGEWVKELPSLPVSVPLPWYFTIPGAEYRLKSKTETCMDISYRSDPYDTILVSVRRGDEWIIVSPDTEDEEGVPYNQRLTFTKNTSGPDKEVYIVALKCTADYSKELEMSEVIIPYDEMIVYDKVGDANVIQTIKIDSREFVRRICICIEPKSLENKSYYSNTALESIEVKYASNTTKLSGDQLRLALDEPWLTSQALPDREGFYMISFSNHNRPGFYDSSVSCGTLETQIQIKLDKPDDYNIRVRVYAYKLAVYEYVMDEETERKTCQIRLVGSTDADMYKEQ